MELHFGPWEAGPLGRVSISLIAAMSSTGTSTFRSSFLGALASTMVTVRYSGANVVDSNSVSASSGTSADSETAESSSLRFDDFFFAPIAFFDSTDDVVSAPPRYRATSSSG